MAEEAKEQREKLIEEMVALEQMRCEAIKCNCLEREKAMNSVLPDSSTRARHVAVGPRSRKILDGTEPWREAREEMKGFKETMLEDKTKKEKEIEELVKTIAGETLDSVCCSVCG